MKLTTNQVIDLFRALSELKGQPVSVTNEAGQKQLIYEPYPMSNKARWNAAKNRDILKRLCAAHDEVMMENKAELDKVRRELMEAAKKEADPAKKAEKLAEMRDVLNEKTEEINDKIRKLSFEEQDVAGILTIPAKDLCPKGTNLSPVIVGELMPLLEGEPDFS